MSEIALFSLGIALVVFGTVWLLLAVRGALDECRDDEPEVPHG